MSWHKSEFDFSYNIYYLGKRKKRKNKKKIKIRYEQFDLQPVEPLKQIQRPLIVREDCRYCNEMITHGKKQFCNDICERRYIENHNKS